MSDELPFNTNLILQKALGTEDEGKLICFNIYNFQREIIENGRNKNIRGSKC